MGDEAVKAVKAGVLDQEVLGPALVQLVADAAMVDLSSGPFFRAGDARFGVFVFKVGGKRLRHELEKMGTNCSICYFFPPPTNIENQ